METGFHLGVKWRMDAWGRTLDLYTWAYAGRRDKSYMIIDMFQLFDRVLSMVSDFK
jgi:hypothetical protein